LRQSSYLSCNDPRLHFGLGPAQANAEVFWPSGLHEHFQKVRANELLTIKEGVGSVQAQLRKPLHTALNE
jgi:hypothetical protein